MVPPVGPHQIEAHITNAVDFSSYVSWLCLNHNSYGAELSALIHPNTLPATVENGILDHSTRAFGWANIKFWIYQFLIILMSYVSTFQCC